jgi:cytochrome c553
MQTAFLAVAAFSLCVPIRANADDSAGLQFFEQKVRPLLAAHCYECHSSATKAPGGGLKLDTRDGIRQGGKSGPAVMPGEPERSLLVKAVRHDGLRMPKNKKKLPESSSADLEAWVKMGAPDPRTANASAKAPGTWEQVLAERRGWWSLQSVRKAEPPRVRNAEWSNHPVDRFLLATLEENGLKPAGPADRRTLIRRLSLVLTGLPPTPDEVEAFVKDNSPEAYPKLVDRLLASSHFGERWAQHWLDVVRYSETHGNEWNYEVQFAYRYRDYLIRAFNQDVPYDQFVREQIAGDLLAQPRWNARQRFNESVIGTAFYRFGDSNVEDCSLIPLVGYDVIDNQIDTLSKAFQATTVACARCHDHKLDAVSMKDYYALAGILHSSRQLSHTLDSPDANAAALKQMRALKADIRKELAALWRRDADDIDRYLLAAQAKLSGAVDAAERARGLEVGRLERWVTALKVEPPENDPADKAKTPTLDLFTPWRSAVATGADGFAAAWRKQAERFEREQRENSAFNQQHFKVLADFRAGSYAGWQAGGQALRDGPTAAGDFALYGEVDALVHAVLPAGCFTHGISEKLNGTLRSPVLPAEAGGKMVSLEVLGHHHSGVALLSHNCQHADYSYQELGDDRLEWVTYTVPSDPSGMRCYLDLCTKFDNPKFPNPIVKPKNKDKENYRVPWDHAAANPRSYFGITRVVLHDGPDAPRPELEHYRRLFIGEVQKPAQAGACYATAAKAALDAWAKNAATDDDVRWIDGLLQRGLFGNQIRVSPRIAELSQQYRDLEAKLTLPLIMPGLGDFGPGSDQPLLTRGDAGRPGAVAPRGYLEVLARPNERFVPTGSGRLELAERIASADNPLTARVMVNRVWQHVFGEGIVRTVDDFGRNGAEPSHRDLLDYLAARFVEDGWSVKRLVRALVLTQAFRLSNQPSEAGRAADPDNRWLHHYAPRRLEAEAIRDSILAASGRLDLAMFGPSIEPFRDSEIPHQRLFSGPFDGRGRRSLYIKRTLMDAPKFLSAFNLPKGNIMQGRRDVTNVPAQALALLNDPFVLQQAEAWADRLVASEDASPGVRIERMFRVALGRPPDQAEKARFVAAASKFAELHQTPTEKVLGSRDVWKDVAHAMFNLKEFIYVP